MKRYETDIIIVGCGVAGMTAALSALETGAKTINVERSTFEERGGNSRWTDANMLIEAGTDSYEPSGFFWAGFEHSSKYHLPPHMEKDAANGYEQWEPITKTGPFLDPELLSAFAEGIPVTLRWLSERGVKIDTAPNPFPFHVMVPGIPQISGGGLAVIEALSPRIEELGGEFLYETTATDLIMDDNGAVRGLKCTGKNNEPVEIHAKAVILASGGFEGNPQMLARYVGPDSKYLRPVAPGGYYNKGEGLKMALAVNAAPAGDWSDVHRQLIDPRAPRHEALTHIWQVGVLVNQNGERFLDEFDSNFNNWHEEPGRAIVKQPGGISYIIYDDEVNSGSYQGWRRGLRHPIDPIKADTLEELAEKLGIPPQNLTRTVEAFNAACTRSDEVELGYANIEVFPFEFDGISTEGISPPKSNGAKRVEKGPFYCYPMISSICLTMGGLRVTPDAQVINQSAEIIPGLYAAGETIGMYYGMYVGGTSVLRGLTFGKISGAHAAANLNTN